MNFEFWKNVKAGDILYFYDTETWKINHFHVKDIKDESRYSGSFILETNHNKHKFIYVNVAKFLMDGLVNTWDHSTCNILFINADKNELIDHCRNLLTEKIKELRNNIDYYNDLLNSL